MEYSIPYTRFERVALYLRSRIAIPAGLCLSAVLNQPDAQDDHEALCYWVRDALSQRWGLRISDQLRQLEAELIVALRSAEPVPWPVETRAVPIGTVIGLFESARMLRPRRGATRGRARVSRHSFSNLARRGRGEHE